MRVQMKTVTVESYEIDQELFDWVVDKVSTGDLNETVEIVEMILRHAPSGGILRDGEAWIPEVASQVTARILASPNHADVAAALKRIAKARLAVPA